MSDMIMCNSLANIKKKRVFSNKFNKIISDNKISKLFSIKAKQLLIDPI